MAVIMKGLVSIGLLLVISSAAKASADTFGQEFVFSFLTPSNTAGVPYLMITTQSIHPARVNVTVHGTNFAQTHVVTGNSILNLTLAANNVFPPNSEESKYNKSVIIRSDSDISVHGMYALVSKTNSAQGAGFMVRPTAMLGKEYVTVAYPPQAQHFTEFSVTALNRLTRVLVRVKAGHDIDLILQPYESFQVRRRLDLTGSVIIADQAVSVMSGASCANVPRKFSYCEHLLTHLPDVNSFGNRYFLGPFLYRSKGYIYRVIASHTATHIQVKSGDLNSVTISKNTGDYYEGEIANSQRQIVTITSDKPIMVVQYAKSRGTDSKGDPFMFVHPPVSLYHGSANFPVTTLPTKFPQKSYISISILCDNSETILVDGENPTWTDSIASDDEPSYCILRKTIESGVHNITSVSNDALYAVIIYGFGRYSSYGYIAAQNSHISRVLQTDMDPLAHNETGISLQCGPTSMTVSIDQSLVLDGRPSDVHLLDSICLARVTSGQTLQIQARYDTCGMISEETNKGSTFRNRLIYNPKNSTVLRDVAIDIPLVCHVKTSVLLSAGAMVPHVGKINTIIERVEGMKTNLTFQFKMFSDTIFEKPYLEYEYPVDVSVKQRLYFEASVSNEIDSNAFVLSIRDIVASVSWDVNEQPNYSFLENGCREDPSLVFHETGQKRLNRFSLSAVGFSGNFSKMFVHCRVIVCNVSSVELCSHKCYDRVGRDTHGFSEHHMSQGPLIIVKGKQRKHGSYWNTFGIPVTMLIIGVAVGCLVTALGWIIYRRYRRRIIHTKLSTSIELSEISYLSD